MLLHFLARIPKIIRAIETIKNPSVLPFENDSADSYFEDRSDDELEEWFKRVQWMKMAYWLDDGAMIKNTSKSKKNKKK